MKGGGGGIVSGVNDNINNINNGHKYQSTCM